MGAIIGAAIVSAVAEVSADAAAFLAVDVGVDIGIGAIGVTGAALLGTAVLAGATYALSRPPGSAAWNQQFTIRQPVPARRRFYGRVKAGGYYAFSQSLNGNMFQIIIICDGPIDGFEEHWLGDVQVQWFGTNKYLAGDTWASTTPFVTGGSAEFGMATPGYQATGGATYIGIFAQNGTVPQSSQSILTDYWPALWDATHEGNGIANVLLVSTATSESNFLQVYAGGLQQYRAVLRGAQIIDPRVTSPAGPSWDVDPVWSQNAALIIADYLTSPKGMRLPTSYITNNLAEWVNEADVCDELVLTKIGNYIARYTINGGYDLDKAPRDVMPVMLAACDGWLTLKGDGSLRLRTGYWIAPTVSLTDENILSCQLARQRGLSGNINVIQAKYIDTDNDYQVSEADPTYDQDDISLRGEEVIKSLDLTHCNSHNQAKRLMKLALARGNPTWQGKITTNAVGLNAMGERFVNLTITDAGIIDESFEVTSYEFNPSTLVCTIGLISFDNSSYSFVAADEEGTAPAVPPVNTSQYTVETPQHVTVSVEGSPYGAIMVVFCDTPTDRSDLSFNVQYQLATSPPGPWQPIPSAYDGTVAGSTTTATSAVLQDGVYNVQVQFTARGGLQSAWVTITDIVVSASTEAPGPTTGLAVTDSGSSPYVVSVKFTAPNSAQMYAARVWRSFDSTFSDAIDVSGQIFGAPNQALSYNDGPGAGTWYYWTTAENVGGNESSPEGPVSIVVP